MHSPQNPDHLGPDETISLHLRLLDEVKSGHVEAIPCPVCRRLEISAWFTHPFPDIYRTWFVCGYCDFHTRVQHAEKPRFFTVTRIRPELEDIDSSILK